MRMDTTIDLHFDNPRIVNSTNESLPGVGWLAEAEVMQAVDALSLLDPDAKEIES